MLVDYKIKAKVIFYNNTDHRLQKKINLFQIKFILKSASNLNGNLNCSKELEHYAS